MQPKARLGTTVEYDFAQGESHGLKELVGLLTCLYDDEYQALVLDEPELHLHPQLQSFLLEHIRRTAGDPQQDAAKKIYFIITHSPYFLDIRTMEDLTNIVVFRPGRPPTYATSFGAEDEFRIRRLLPRLNTHHKQLFFATQPVFVEGYSDQNILQLIEEKRGRMIGASGGCIIDVGGKDELDIFFRLCSQLGLEARIVADLDVLFSGRLRQTVSQDSRSIACIQAAGLGRELMTVIGQLERELDDLADNLKALEPVGSPKLARLIDLLRQDDEQKNRRYYTLVGVCNARPDILQQAPNLDGPLTVITAKYNHILEAFGACQVFVLPKGALENHLPAYTGDIFKIPESDKARVLECETQFLLDPQNSAELTTSRYPELVRILDRALPVNQVDFGQPVGSVLADWIHTVQKLVMM